MREVRTIPGGTHAKNNYPGSSQKEWGKFFGPEKNDPPGGNQRFHACRPKRWSGGLPYPGGETETITVLYGAEKYSNPPVLFCYFGLFLARALLVTAQKFQGIACSTIIKESGDPNFGSLILGLVGSGSHVSSVATASPDLTGGYSLLVDGPSPWDRVFGVALFSVFAF